MSIENTIKAVIRDIPDFPKPGILFKDITPIFQEPELCAQIVDAFVDQLKHLQLDAIACVEARGFFFGPMIAQKLNIPFVPIRKVGKLPYDTISHSYDLEYGSAEIEMHKDGIKSDWKVLIHDDLLATGGTAAAAAELINSVGDVVGFSFLVDLTFLGGVAKLQSYSDDIYSLVEY